jgi:hypothetical protein
VIKIMILLKISHQTLLSKSINEKDFDQIYWRSQGKSACHWTK